MQGSRLVIICGLGQVGWMVLEHLQCLGWTINAIDLACDPHDPRLGSARLIRGDCRDPNILQAAGVASAQAVMILTKQDVVNLTTALAVCKLNKDVRIVARFFNQNLIQRLGKGLPQLHLLSKSALTAPIFALTALAGDSLGSFQSLGQGYEITELKVTARHPWVGHTLDELKQHFGVEVVGHETRETEMLTPSAVVSSPSHLPLGSDWRWLEQIRWDGQLLPGDRIIVVGPEPLVAKLRELASEEQQIVLRWASWMRRFGRIVWRTLVDIEMPVKLVFGMFMVVILLSALIFYFYDKPDLAEGMYRTVSVMATAADMKADAKDEALKLFVTCLRIAGIVLTAALTALLTNYLVRARLGGAFVVGRIPDSGHVVVCGLGSLGIRIVEQLRQRDIPVVVVERAESRHTVEARRVKAVVLIGDATLPEMLTRARVREARACILATSNDLVNVEIALMIKDQNPKQRIVMRLEDEPLAKLLRETNQIRHAHAVASLAAPALVAALYRERILGMFWVKGVLLGTVEFKIDPMHHHLVGQKLLSLASQLGFIPLHWQRDGRTLPRVLWTENTLQAGDQLTLLLRLHDLDKLLDHDRKSMDQAG